MKELLKIEEVTTGYDARVVLEKVSLTINSDDFIGVIGPNGGGKTTLLKLILGLLKPWSGRVHHFSEEGRNINIGYMPQMQQGNYDFPVTVLDVVLSGLMAGRGASGRMKRPDKEKAEKVIDELGLTEYCSETLCKLSGGQLQRVMLGRALIGSPRLLLLDEPVSFADTEFEKGFYEKLNEYSSRMAILMVSHDVGTISSYVKSFACVNRVLNYHPSGKITDEQLRAYGCPIQLVAHGDVPHIVLNRH